MDSDNAGNLTGGELIASGEPPADHAARGLPEPLSQSLVLLAIWTGIELDRGRLNRRNQFLLFFNLPLLPALALLLRFFPQFVLTLTLLKSLAWLCDGDTSSWI